MPADWIDFILAGAIGGSAYFLWHRRPIPTPDPARHPSAGATAHPPNPGPPGFLPVLPAETLFRETAALPLLTDLRQSLGLAPENHARDVDPLMQAMAEFVQLLPASESHHHANPGGLLIHLLEVAVIALKKCEAAKLPIGRATDEQLKHAARWRYGVMLAAILHDIGKPISDVQVTIATGQQRLPWNGMTGKIGDYGAHYAVAFPLTKDYQAHQRLPILLLQNFLPQPTLRWLADDPELIRTLIAYLSGESDGGIVGSLVKEADRKSVADNLLKGPRTRFASARQTPLIERMMDALRRMLAEGGHLPLNREGAAGFCDGQEIWFVAGTVADKVRQYLDKNEIRESGAAGLPTDNSRLFDVWMDYGALIPNGGAAIWKARIHLDKGDGKSWSQSLTVIRFPLKHLFADPAHYPAPLVGTLHVEVGTPAPIPVQSPAASTLPVQPTSPAPIETITPNEAPAAAVADLALAPVAFADEFALAPTPLGDHLPSEPSQETIPAAVTKNEQDAFPLSPVMLDDEFLDPADTASAAPLVPLATPPLSAAEIPVAPLAPAQKSPPKESVLGQIAQPAPEIERLIAWIQRGVGDGSLKFNRASSAIHFVAEGMLLISPKIFRDYLEHEQVVVDGDSTQVKRLQRLLQKSGYVSKNLPNSYLHHYRITNARNPARANVAGYLLAQPGALFNPVPAANVLLEPSPGHTARTAP